jgi:ATP-dependent Lon protease
LAAKRAKIAAVILPKRNEKDIEEIPKHLLRGITLLFAETMDDVLKASLRHPKAAAKKAADSGRASRRRRAAHEAPRRSPRPQPIAPSLSVSATGSAPR